MSDRGWRITFEVPPDDVYPGLPAQMHEGLLGARAGMRELGIEACTLEFEPSPRYCFYLAESVASPKEAETALWICVRALALAGIGAPIEVRANATVVMYAYDDGRPDEVGVFPHTQ